MENGTRFNWATLGKADYSQACAIVASIPEPIRRHLSGPTRELLCRITFLCWTYAARSGRGKAYCIPSEKWLGHCVARSERTVRRCLTVLSKYGLVSWIRRRGAGNTWTSNLYELGKQFLASLYARAGKKLQQIHQRTKMADNDLKKGIEAGPLEQVQASNSSYLAKLRDQLPRLASRHAVAFAPQVVEDKGAVNDRKAALKLQAEALKARGL